MDEWESVERKLRELQKTFLKKGHSVPHPPSYLSYQTQVKEQTVPPQASDFWKQRYEQEKRLWEEQMLTKEKEQEQVQEKLTLEAQNTLELKLKIEALMRQFETARTEWEENPKIKLLESELSRQETDYGIKINTLNEENEQLRKEFIQREKELAIKEKNFTEEEFKKREALEKERKKLEEQNVNLEKKIFEVQQNFEAFKKEKTKADQKTLEEYLSEKKRLDEQLKNIKTDYETQKKYFEDQIKNIRAEREKESEEKKKIEKMLSDTLTDRDRQLAFLLHKIHNQFKTFETMTQGFSHRMKTNLQITDGALKETLKNPETGDELKKQVSFSMQYAGEMFKNIEEFVALAKNPEIILKPSELNPFLEKISNSLAGEFQKKEITLKKEFPDTLPTILMDENLIGEAVKNILLNAIEFSLKNSSVILSSRHDTESNAVIIQISDSGTGIPAHLQEKVFQPYFTTLKGRKGLGLTAAKRAIELNHGDLTLSSVENRGTQVSVHLPVPPAPK